MKQRSLYLVAYDIANPKRLRQAMYAIKEYATGGQKSVFECYLSDGELTALRNTLRDVLHAKEDRLFIVRLDGRCRMDALGIGIAPSDPVFFYRG